MNWESYLALGDSITIGARSYLGYPEIVGGKLSRKLKKDWHVINHAISGYTCIDLVRYVDEHFDRLKNSCPVFCTSLIGTNDVKIGTSLTDFKLAYYQLVVKLMLINSSDNILLIKIPVFLDGVMLPYKLEMNSLIHEYNNAIEDLASQFKLKTLKFDFQKDHFYDGVHLNDLGNEFVSSILTDYILKQRGL